MTSAPTVVGLDLSLTCTGVALGDGSTRKVATSAAERLEVRLAVIVEGIGEALDACEADGATTELVVIEDLPKNARAAGMTGPVHGAVRLWLHRLGMPVVMVPAASVKKYATGKGNCGKEAMGIAAMKRAGLDFSDRNDECDAWWLRAMALDAYGHAVVELPASQREALERVQWPSLSTLSVAS